jgi:hypothetical protein
MYHVSDVWLQGHHTEGKKHAEIRHGFGDINIRSEVNTMSREIPIYQVDAYKKEDF